MPGVAIVIPAAGASARMGGCDKLLERVAGLPLLRRQADAALATGAPVLVTLPPDRPARRAALAELEPALEWREVPNAAEGMAASLRVGADWAAGRDAAGLMILPADMPDLTRADLAHCIAAFDDTRILRATAADGRPGHPVIFPRACLPALARLSGDCGARDLLKGADIALLTLPGTHALTDLDTPADWAAWRARHGS